MSDFMQTHEYPDMMLDDIELSNITRIEKFTKILGYHFLYEGIAKRDKQTKTFSFKALDPDLFEDNDFRNELYTYIDVAMR